MENIKAQITAYTSIGEISGRGLVPLGASSFFMNLHDKEDDNINIGFASLEFADSISIGAEIGNIILEIPEGSIYHHLVEDFKIENIDNKEARKLCLKKPTDIKKENEKTIITSNVDDPPIASVTIKEGHYPTK